MVFMHASLPPPILLLEDRLDFLWRIWRMCGSFCVLICGHVISLSLALVLLVWPFSFGPSRVIDDSSWLVYPADTHVF